MAVRQCHLTERAVLAALENWIKFQVLPHVHIRARSGGASLKQSAAYPRSFGDHIAKCHMDYYSVPCLAFQAKTLYTFVKQHVVDLVVVRLVHE